MLGRGHGPQRGRERKYASPQRPERDWHPLAVDRVRGLLEPADLLTKHLARQRHETLMDLLNLVNDDASEAADFQS